MTRGPLNPGFTADGFMFTLAVQAIGGAFLVTRYSPQHTFAYERDLQRQEEEHRHAEGIRVELENRYTSLAAVHAEINANDDAVAWMEEGPRAAFLLGREMLNQCFVVLPVLPRTLAKALVEASIDIDRYNATVIAQMEATDPRALLRRASGKISEYLVINTGMFPPDRDDEEQHGPARGVGTGVNPRPLRPHRGRDHPVWTRPATDGSTTHADANHA